MCFITFFTTEFQCFVQYSGFAVICINIKYIIIVTLCTKVVITTIRIRAQIYIISIFNLFQLIKRKVWNVCSC